MFAHNEQELKSCCQNNDPCILLKGYRTQEEWEQLKLPTSRYMIVSCLIGCECGRGTCRFYETSNDKI